MYELSEDEKQRIREKDLLAYNIARQIADFAETYGEVEDVIKQVGNIFNWYKREQKPEIYPYPVGSGGRRIEMPGEESPGMNE